MISIVQLTHNNRAQVRRFLPTVARLASRRDVGEWIVLDNASTDGTLDELAKIRHKKLRVVASETNLGCGAGRQKLWPMATGDLILSLDSDVAVRNTNTIGQMVADLGRPRIGVVGEAGGWVRADWTWTELAPTRHFGEVPIVCGFCQLVRRDAVEVLMRQKIYAPYWLDDTEFCLGLAARGLSGWINRYGFHHRWSHTNAGNNSNRLRIWAEFRERWERRGLGLKPADMTYVKGRPAARPAAAEARRRGGRRS